MRTLRSLPRQPGAYDSVLDDLARRAQFPAALEVVENLGIRTQKAGAILGEALAANLYAGTSGLTVVGALNAKAGTKGLGLQGVANVLAGTTGLGVCLALSKIATPP